MQNHPDREHRFRRLYEDNHLDLTRFVERRVEVDAEDVVATVFLTAWRRLDDAPADVRPWLFVIAKNTIGNHYRSAFRRRRLDVRLAEEPPPELVGENDRDRWLDLAAAWRRLSARDREILALVSFDGLTSEEAAAVLEIPRSTATMRLSRARRRLGEALAAPAPSLRPITTTSRS